MKTFYGSEELTSGKLKLATLKISQFILWGRTRIGRRIFPKFNSKNFKPHDGPQREFMHGNWHEAIFGTPEEREIERINLLNKNVTQIRDFLTKKKELQMDEAREKKELQMDEARESKHVMISNLTDDLEEAANVLQKLVNRVQGEVAKEEVEKDVRDHGGTPLSAFLAEYPKRIEEITGRITEATNRLKAILY